MMRSMPEWAAFNSRPHKEVDPSFTNPSVVRFIFQLTTSQGGRPLLNPFSDISVSFQLTTSQGGRLAMAYGQMSSAGLSTHDLTRRSTSHLRLIVKRRNLSTHDLTRRSTIGKIPITQTDILSTHDLTRRSTCGSSLVFV